MQNGQVLMKLSYFYKRFTARYNIIIIQYTHTSSSHTQKYSTRHLYTMDTNHRDKCRRNVLILTPASFSLPNHCPRIMFSPHMLSPISPPPSRKQALLCVSERERVCISIWSFFPRNAQLCSFHALHLWKSQTKL